MHATQFIRHALDSSATTLLTLAQDMRNASLTFPTPRGGNHPLWVLGHLAVTESQLTHSIILGRDHPLAHWMGIFGPGTTPVADPVAYPSLDEVIRAFKETRAATLAALDSMTDADLDKASPGCPPEFAPVVGTLGKCLFAIIYHTSIHSGQVIDARRAAGRAPMLFTPPNPALQQSLASVA
jgi:hypothetical protein